MERTVVYGSVFSQLISVWQIHFSFLHSHGSSCGCSCLVISYSLQAQFTWSCSFPFHILFMRQYQWFIIPIVCLTIYSIVRVHIPMASVSFIVEVGILCWVSFVASRSGYSISVFFVRVSSIAYDTAFVVYSSRGSDSTAIEVFLQPLITRNICLLSLWESWETAKGKRTKSICFVLVRRERFRVGSQVSQKLKWYIEN